MLPIVVVCFNWSCATSRRRGTPSNSVHSISFPLTFVKKMYSRAGCCWILLIFSILLEFPQKCHALRPKRERAAFDLLRLEQQLDLDFSQTRSLSEWELIFLFLLPGDQPRVEPEEEEAQNGQESEGDEAERCRQKCNSQLRMGLDMVKAHSAFGSIGVPSVIDQLDLELFCRLDAAHDQCLIGCGYQVEFNLRDFVCKKRKEELISHLECFASAAPRLKRHCGATRCGPYSELELSVLGVGQRCRTLLCDLGCTRQVLSIDARCRDSGASAGQFLLAYSQLQVFSWLRQMFTGPINSVWQNWPRSCAKLLCGTTMGPKGEGVEGASGNCTLPDHIFE